MNKSLGLFFGSLFLGAIGIGSFYAAANRSNGVGVDAKSTLSYVTFDDKGTCRLGSYPQYVCDTIPATEIKNNGELKQTTSGDKYYVYQSKKYAIIETAVVDNEQSAGRLLSNGAPADSYNGQTDVVISFEDIEWQLLKLSDYDDVAYLISTNILDRQIYNPSLPTHVAYGQSALFTYLNTTFKEMAFTAEDYKYIAYSESGLEKVLINIPEKSDVDLDAYEDKNLKQASDFAILKNLTSHSAYNHGVGVPFTNAGYWLNSLSSDPDRVDVCWAKVAISHCLMDDPKIGVRPVIEVNYKVKGSGGGSSTPTATVNIDGGAVTLGLGIAFTVLGAGGLIAFFVIWAKKHPTGKPPIWIIVSIAGSLVVSVAGLGCMAGGMNGAGGGGCLKMGYYVQTGQHSGGGITQLGYTAWLIKYDGTASYCTHLTDAAQASDFAPDNYMTGTYKINGSKLVITIPKHEIQNFGTVGGTYTYNIKGCENFQNYDGAYHWVRGE